MESACASPAVHQRLAGRKVLSRSLRQRDPWKDRWRAYARCGDGARKRAIVIDRWDKDNEAFAAVSRPGGYPR